MTTAIPSPRSNSGPLPVAPDMAWSAVLGRDRTFDGQFVFAVSSTRVYCRPSCPARRPHRANVNFFPTPEAAQAAGYRPCRRCDPDAAMTLTDHAIVAALQYLDAHPDELITLDVLATRIGFSKFHLQRTFKRFVGLSPRQYQAARRMDRFKSAVQAGQSLTSAAYAAGFGSGRALYEQAPSALGMTPATYRAGGRGVRITYATAPSPMGQILLGTTSRGICALFFGQSEAELIPELTREFPNADLARDDAILRQYLPAILATLAGTPSQLPLDLHGTPFQMRVWQALRSIPCGATRTYTQIAEAIGAPTSVRAVASACARNRIALLIPCHRVIGRDGALTGYRWGLSRKQALLDAERSR